MTRDIAPYLSAVSAMLAAYAFFFNSFKDRIEKAEAVGRAKPVHSDWEKQVKEVETGRRTARWLTGVPLFIWALFLDKNEDAVFHSTLDPARYETLDVLFFVLANAWIVIAILVGRRARALSEKLAKLRNAEPPAVQRA